MTWIPVEAELPEEFTDCLVWLVCRYEPDCTGFYTAERLDGWLLSDGYPTTNERVTHWMIPEPPV